MIKKAEERSEHLSMWVSPKVKKEFEFSKNNPDLQEEIIRRYITREKDWLEEEIKEIDDSTVKYKAKLIGIKEQFAKAQSSYIEEIESIYNLTSDTFKKLNNMADDFNKKFSINKYSMEKLTDKINEIPVYKLTELLDTIDRFDRLSEKQKEMIELLLK